MSIVWHILKKDARVLRGPWIVWVGLQIAALVVAWKLAAYAIIDHSDPMDGYLRVAYLALSSMVWGFAYLFVPLALQDDPVSGSSAGWVPRPITPLQMLAAKAMGIVVLFILTPVVVRLPWWLMNGFDAGTIMQAAGETVKMGTMIAVPSVWLASVTADASRFYRWSLPWVVGLVGVFVFAARIWIDSDRLGFSTFSGWDLRWIAALLVVSTVDQFWNRNTRRSLQVVGAGLAGLLLFPKAFGTFRDQTPRVNVTATVGRDGLVQVEASTPNPGEAGVLRVIDGFLRGSRRVPLSGATSGEQMQSQVMRLTARSRGTPEPQLVRVTVPSDPSGTVSSPLRVHGRVMKLGASQVLPLREGERVSGDSRRLRIDRVLSDLGGDRHLVAVTETTHAGIVTFSEFLDADLFLVLRSSGPERVAATHANILSAASVLIRKRILSVPTRHPRESLEEVALLRVYPQVLGRFETDLIPAGEPSPPAQP